MLILDKGPEPIYPRFENITTSCTSAFDESHDICFKVRFSNDEEIDYIWLDVVPNAFNFFEGKLKNEDVTVMFSLPDPEDDETEATV